MSNLIEVGDLRLVWLRPQLGTIYDLINSALCYICMVIFIFRASLDLSGRRMINHYTHQAQASRPYPNSSGSNAQSYGGSNYSSTYSSSSNYQRSKIVFIIF